ncbi:MAG: SagB/ThcOx family dehydrogenase [Candidatus Thorarchaeota archaeon]
MPGVGDEFHSATKYERGKLPGHRLDWSTKPSVYKKYPDATKIDLPPPVVQGGPGLWEVLRTRRSVRAYTQDAMSLGNLSQILWATQGITASIGNHRLRTAPSAGALYPIETYLLVNRVDGLEPGIYHFDVEAFQLDILRLGDFSREVKTGALDQQIAERASVVFIWSAIFQRSKWKYLQRAYRYIFLDAAHIAQNLALAAEGLSLGSCQIGALYDDYLNELLGLNDNEESVIYLSSIGRPSKLG